LVIFEKDGQDDIIMYGALILPHDVIYVNTLPCETQMLQIVTLCGDYLYQMAHLCFINSTESATWFILLSFEVLNILC